MKQMALMLQGGGALGAFEYGAVSRLVELGWCPTVVTGVSIGAINAAAIAGAVGGDIRTSLKRLWHAITLPQLPWLPASQQGSLSMFGNPAFYRNRIDYLNMGSWTSLCDTTPMLDTLARLCNFEQINNPGHMRFGVTATDLQTGALTTFSNHLPHGSQARGAHHSSLSARITPSHVMASGSLPPGFPATVIEGSSYWDGGLFSNTPFDALLNMLEPEEVRSLPIFVIDLFPSAGLPLPTNLSEVQNRAMLLQYQNRFWAQYGGGSELGDYVRMLEALDGALPEQAAVRSQPSYVWLQRQRALANVRVIQAEAATSAGTTDFSAYAVKAAFDAGAQAVDRHFAATTALPAPALHAVAAGG